MSFSSRLARALLAAVIPWAVACIEDNASPIVGGPSNVCSTNADCRDGVCNVSQRRCVTLARTEVSFVVTPPGGMANESAYPTLSTPRTIRTGDALDLNLSAPHTVYGTVSVASTDPQGAISLAPVLATVTFTHASLPGFLLPFTAHSDRASLPTINRDTMAFTWSMVVPEGVYDVAVTPTSESSGRVPPRFESSFDVGRESSFHRFDIAYPPAYTRWSGVVQDVTGAGLTGLTVRAIDPARNGRAVSTVVHTGATPDLPGAFAIDLAPGAPSDWTLRVSSEPAAGGGFTLDLPRAVLQRNHPTGRDVVLRLPAEVRQLYVPTTRPSGQPPGATPPASCLGCVRVSASVEGRAPDGASRPLRDASVTLHASIPMSQLGDGVSAWFEVRATTDAEGAFSAWLIPGDYDVHIAPQGSTFANGLTHGFRVRDDQGVQNGRIFTLEPRVAVEGRIITPAGDPVRSARVSAVPFHAAYVRNACIDEIADMRALAPRANRVESTTQADGSYRLDVDPGLYRVLIEPGDNSGFAATLSRTVCVPPLGVAGSTARVGPFDVRLEPPVEIHGVVRDAQRRLAPGASIQAVIRVAEPDAAGVVLSVGRANAGASGAYTLLLPAASATQ